MHTIAAWINDTMAPNMEAIIIKTMPPPNRMAHRAKAATKICANSFISRLDTLGILCLHETIRALHSILESHRPYIWDMESQSNAIHVFHSDKESKSYDLN